MAETTWGGTAEHRRHTSRVNVGTAERWASMAAGAALTAWAMRERDRRAGLAAIVGAGLLYRGGTGHCPAYAAAGVDRAHPDSATKRELGGAGGIHVDESVTIAVPADQLFRFWRQFENLPSFMKHLDSVTEEAPNRWRWVARGPAKSRVSWSAEVINEVPNRVIGWQSLEGSTVTTAGSVRFDEVAGDRGTRVRVHLQYHPPAGRLGAAFAWLFGREPSQTVRDDLRRLKRLIETGETPTIEGQPHGRRSVLSSVIHPMEARR